MGEKRRITVLKNGVNVGCDLFVAPQDSGAIPGDCRGRVSPLSKFRCQRDCLRDVFHLGILVTTGQQHDQILAALYEIHPISRAIVDPQFRDARTDRPNIARISKARSVDASLDAGTGGFSMVC